MNESEKYDRRAKALMSLGLLRDLAEIHRAPRDDQKVILSMRRQHAFLVVHPYLVTEKEILREMAREIDPLQLAKAVGKVFESLDSIARKRYTTAVLNPEEVNDDSGDGL